MTLLLPGAVSMIRVTDPVDLGNIAEDAPAQFLWGTFGCCGGSITRETNGTVKVNRVSDDTDVTGTSVTDAEDTPDVGVHSCIVATSDNADYIIDEDYVVWVDGMVVDGQTLNAVIARFSIENRFDEVALNPPAAITAGGGDARRFSGIRRR